MLIKDNLMGIVSSKYISTRRLMGSTAQADSSFFLLPNFIIIDGKTLFLFFSSPPLCSGPPKPQKLNASKLSM